MTDWLAAAVRAWTHAGTARAHNHSHRRKILHGNSTALMTLGLIAIFGVWYAVNGNSALVRMGWIQAPLYPIMAAIPWLNHRGHHGAARLVLLWSVTIMLAVGTWMATGTDLHLHILHIVVAMAGVVLIPLRHWHSASIVVLINSALFVYAEVRGVVPHTGVLDLEPTTALALRVAYACTTLVAILCIVLVGEIAARRNERQLEDLSGRDPLTQLPNRRRFMERLGEAVAAARRTGDHAMVIFLDLDHFKALNDQHGHDAGDILLREVARRISASLREMNIAARIGGDEFVLLLIHLGQSRDMATAGGLLVAERIRASLGEPYAIELARRDPFVHRCTASIGAALFTGDTTPDQVLQSADSAMYRAKAAGGDRVVAADAGVAPTN